MVEDAFRILVCGLSDECRDLASVARDKPRYALISHSTPESPAELIVRAKQAAAPIEAAIITTAWLEADAARLPLLLDADPDICAVLQAAPSHVVSVRPASDRVLIVPKDDRLSLTLAGALAQSRRAQEAKARTEADLQTSLRAYNLVSHEFQRQNRRLEHQEEVLRLQKELFETALNNMSQGLSMYDANANLVVCNARYLEMYDLPAELATPGRPLREILEYRARSGRFVGDPQAYYSDIIAAIAKGKPHTVLGSDGGRTILIVNQPMANGGWVVTFEDITERTKAEAQIRYMACHDGLTGLANRSAFQEEMQQALKRVGRGEQLAVLCIDLDFFKNVNDTLGHLVGDKLLCAAARRLQEGLREADTIARLGGDEFAILQSGPCGPERAGALAQRLISGINQPYVIDGHTVVVGASIGVAIAPHDGTSTEQLLRNADMALYRAKSEGRATFRFFEPEMDAQLQARRLLELDLRKALANGEFELYYQPQLNVLTEVVTGCEALLRWNHPTRGLVAPGDFVPLAEEIGLIVPIGEWVLRQACAEAASGRDRSGSR